MKQLRELLADALLGPRCQYGDGCTVRVYPRDRVLHWSGRHDPNRMGLHSVWRPW